MKRNHQDSFDTCETSNKPESSSMSNGKSKVYEEQDPSGGMDELLEVLGYKVRSSDMADVAQKLEQLEMAIGTAQNDDLTTLTWDTSHYNPSDLSGWLESMISGLNQTNQCDLRAIPGVAAFPDFESPLSMEEKSKKRLKIFSDFETELTQSVVVIDSEESGIRLVHTLMACAEAVEQNNLQLADTLVKRVGLLAASQSGAMRKVATYFAEALARRIYRIFPIESLDSSYSDLLQSHFYETSPYLKFAHFTANQAILEAFTNSSKVHVIDLGLKQGMQWPALIQALARSRGPPSFRLTGIGNNSDSLQQVGLKLSQLAQTIGVEFKFRGIMVNTLTDLEPSMLEILSGDEEPVAVNSIFELHGLLARPGSIENLLATIKRIKPVIFTIVEQEANHNEPGFLTRFNEALHYYSNLFDSLEGTSSASLLPSQDMIMSELYLGRQICNVVACEGKDRVERHELLTRWRIRMGLAGFDPVCIGSNAFKQASMLLALFGGGDAYRVEENNGCLTLGWHTRPLIATSAWKLGSA